MKFNNQWPIVAALFIAVPALAQEVDYSADISDVSRRIAEAEKTIASFEGGVIKTLAQYRLETLKMNRALLENRQLGAEAKIQP